MFSIIYDCSKYQNYGYRFKNVQIIKQKNIQFINGNSNPQPS